MSKSTKQRGGIAKPPSSMHQQPDISNHAANQTGVEKTNICSDCGRSKHWWNSFTNDIGMFGLTAGTLIVLWFYNFYTRTLVTDTETSYTAVQRAFVSPEQPIRVESSGSGNDKIWTFTTNIRNDGATPTKNLLFYQSSPCIPHNGSLVEVHHSGPNYRCDFTTKNGQVAPPEPSDPNAVLREPTKFNIKTYPLAPHGSITVDSVSVSEADIAKMADDNHPLFIHGIAYYNDIFKDSEPHTTEYCVIDYHVGW